MSSAYDSTDAQQGNRVLNGFAMLTLTPDSISEEFIDQTGTKRWSNPTPMNEQPSAFAGLSGGAEGEVQS